MIQLGFRVVRPLENHNGMSYSQWAMSWCNWLFSEDPDTYDGGDVLFLRGNVNYQPVSGSESGPRFIDPMGLYDRTGERGQTIFTGTSILVPVIVAMFIPGELYEGKRLETPEQLRYSASIEIQRSGPMWATIMAKRDKNAHKIVKNLKDFYITTPLFRLIVPEYSKLMAKTDLPYKPGTYDMVAAGIFLVITSLHPSTYRINFGGRTGAYHTDSVYDITIHGKKRESLTDVSSKRRAVVRPWK